MKTWSLLALLVLAAVPARAQVDLLHEERLGSLYLSARPDAYVNYVQQLSPNSPFNFYLVIDVDFSDIEQEPQNASNGIQAWEAQVSLPVEFFVLGATLSPNTSINVGPTRGNTYDFLVGTGALVPAGGPQVLVTFQALYVNGWCLMGQLGPVANPSVAGEAVWVESTASNGCSINGRDEPCQFRFAILGDMSFLCLGAAEPQTFGAMKARF